MWSKVYASVVVVLLVRLESVAAETSDSAEVGIVQKYFGECNQRPSKWSCVADRASMAVEKAMDFDIPLFPGLTYFRNEVPTPVTMRGTSYGVDRLASTLTNFFKTHSLDVDFQDEARRRRVRRFGYLIAAAVSAIGFTGTIFLKGIAIIAAKALMVSKIALLLVSIIGLKKLFAKKHEPAIVQVHSLHDEHDRNLNSALYNVRNVV